MSTHDRLIANSPYEEPAQPPYRSHGVGESGCSPLHGDLSRLPGGQHPGVYLLAYSDEPLAGRHVDLRDVLYVGMSNSQGGVSRRLRRFKRAIEGRDGRHSGSRRFLKEYAHGTPYSQLEGRKTFFVAWLPVPCDEVQKGLRTEAALRLMGDVAALEYYVLASIKAATGQEPALNGK
jgi:hypothetical protein